MSSGIFSIGINASNGSLLLTKQGTLVLDFSQTGPAAFNTRVADGDKGDITVADSGTQWTVDARAITPAKLFEVGYYKLLGRYAGTAGDAQEVGLGGGLEFSSSTIQRSALTGDVTATAGSSSTTIVPASNPSWITALAWSKITGTPTTLSGYGITDAAGLVHTHPSTDISDSTSAGRTLLTAANAAAQRTALGLGTVATQDANNVSLTGGTLQGVGVVTGTYTSNVNEAILRSARKASAGTITKGQVVYITGSTGSHLEVELADADLEATSSKTFGVAVENITSSSEGYVIVEGLLTGLSNLPTASFADGDSLWLSSTAGGWQSSPPANPAHGVYLGRVITASNGSSGRAYIKIQNGYELDELHDVVITTPASTHSLFYDSGTMLWKNRRPALSDISQSSASTGQFVEWNGSDWVAASITASDISDSTSAGRALITAANAAAQRSSLGLGGAALLNVGTASGTVAAGDDARLSDARTPTAHQSSHRLGGSDTITPLTQSMGDADATVSAGATYVRTSATFTAPRTLTLPAASTVPAGLSIVVLDTFGAINGANTLTVIRAGSDTINGATTAVIGTARAGRVLTSDGVSVWTFDNGVLRTSQNLSDVPSAATARANLGLGTAAVRADTDFVRFDADQSATATQKRTARFNIGFADSFTTAELLALSSSDSSRLRTTYCSDCFSSAGQQWDSFGDMVYWNGSTWLTVSDRVPITTEWIDWVYHMARNSTGHAARPSATWWSWTGSSGHLDQSYTSGAGGSSTGTGADSGNGAISWLSPGTTTTGVSRGIIGPLSGTMRTAPYRRIGFAVSHLSFEPGVSGDSFHWRYSIEPAAFTANMARQTDHIGFVGDPFNLFGEGATGSNIFAYARLNGTTLLWANTGITSSQSAWLVGTWEPTSGLNGAGVFKLASWRSGVKTTHHGSNSGTYGGTTAQVAVGAAKGGSGTTFLRAYRRADYVLHKFFTAPSAET